MRHAIGFVHRVMYALLTAIVVWILYVFPFDGRALELRFTAVKVLDWPVAIVSRRMPPELRAIDVFSAEPFAHNAPAEEMLLLHLRLAVPVYVILFYVPSFMLWIIRKLRQRRGHRPIET